VIESLFTQNSDASKQINMNQGGEIWSFCIMNGLKLGLNYPNHIGLGYDPFINQNKSYKFGTTWGRVINDRIEICWWIIPSISTFTNTLLKSKSCIC